MATMTQVRMSLEVVRTSAIAIAWREDIENKERYAINHRVQSTHVLAIGSVSTISIQHYIALFF